jgi:hypothetical protein
VSFRATPLCLSEGRDLPEGRGFSRAVQAVCLSHSERASAREEFAFSTFCSLVAMPQRAEQTSALAVAISLRTAPPIPIPGKIGYCRLIGLSNFLAPTTSFPLNPSWRGFRTRVHCPSRTQVRVVFFDNSSAAKRRFLY